MANPWKPAAICLPFVCHLSRRAPHGSMGFTRFTMILQECCAKGIQAAQGILLYQLRGSTRRTATPTPHGTSGQTCCFRFDTPAATVTPLATMEDIMKFSSAFHPDLERVSHNLLPGCRSASRISELALPHRVSRRYIEHQGDMACRQLSHRLAVAEVARAMHTVKFAGQRDHMVAGRKLLTAHDT